MICPVIKCVLILQVMFFETHAFWWDSPTTESPASVSIKHIPLTYYRTYTYQPLPGAPYPFPFGYGGAAQTPLLNGGRYEQFQFPPNQNFAGGPLLVPPPMPYPQQPAASPTTTTAATPPTTQSTTTTTTTTPAPTTTTQSTTTTTTTTPPPPPPSPNPMQPLINAGGGTFGAAPQYEPPIYPTYNRRLYMNNYNEGNFYRPHYPYPDYATTTANQRPSAVQFVPCMCPVGVGIGASGMPIMGGPATATGVGQNYYMAQARIDGEDDDADMGLLLDEDEVKGKNSEGAEEPSADRALFRDDSQTINLETNKIDGEYRKRKTEDGEVAGS